MSELISILIADDHALFADTFAGWLEAADDMHVVAVVENGDDAVSRAIEHKPDVVLLDIDMPGLSCFEAARLIVNNCPECAIIFISAHTHDYYIEQAFAVEAAGYVTKSEPPETVATAIRAAVSGGAYFSPDVQSRIIVDASGVRLASPLRTRLSLLTPRELNVLRLLAMGLSKRDIARELFLSVKTIDTHTTKLMDKLNIHDRVELARFAIREGLAQP